MSNSAPAPAENAPLLPPATLDKYKAAAGVASNAIAKLIEKAVAGAGVLELCEEGDKLVEQGTGALYNKDKNMQKGIAFPTSIAVNSVIQNYSPLPSDEAGSTQKLADGDVVKICLGAHFDGFATISSETVVVGAKEVTDVRADLLAAANTAVEAALRSVKAGGKNWDVTDSIKQVLAEYEGKGIKGVEGMLSHQFEQNNIEAKKGVVAFPTLQQRADSDNAFQFEEGEVYGLNIVVTNGDKGSKSDASRTTIYQKTSSSYMLKMKASRATFSEISKKAGSFPFTLRTLEEEKKARMGVLECVQHGLLKPFEVMSTDKQGDLSAQAFVTFAVGKNAAIRLSGPPTFYSPERVKSDVEIKSDELKALLARSLKPKAAKKAKKGEAKAE